MTETSPTPSAPDPLDLRGMLAVLRRQMALILQLSLTVVLLAVLYLVFSPRAYTATALLRVDPFASALVEQTGSGAQSISSRIDTEVEILRSDGLALRTIGAESLVRDPAFGPRLGWGEKIRASFGNQPEPGGTRDAGLQQTLVRFDSALAVRRVGLTDIISVSLTTSNPQRAADIANAHAEGFISDQIEAKHRAAEAARQALAAELDAARLRFERGEADLQAARDHLDGGQPMLSGAERTDLEQAFATGDWEKVTALLADESLAALVRQRDQLQRSLEGTTAPPPDLQSELAALESRLARETRAALAILDSDAPTESSLTELYLIQQEALIARRQYEQVMQALRDLEARATLRLADARIVSPALPPLAASAPRPGLVLIVAALIAAGLSIAGALLKEFHFGGITSPQQLRNVLPVPVAASVPSVRIAGSDEVMADAIFKDPLSPISESFRRLRATIDLKIPQQRGAATVITVTSAFAGEGKSTVALSLARTYAAAGQRCLLIDADFRNPAIHRLIRATPPRGLLEFLETGSENGPTDEEIASSFYIADTVPGLHVVLGAQPADGPTDKVLQSAGFTQLVRNARTLFDVVILDTPPLIPVVDARYLVSLTDVYLFCVRAGFADQRLVREAFRDLPLAHGMTMSVLIADPDAGSVYKRSYRKAA